MSRLSSLLAAMVILAINAIGYVCYYHLARTAEALARAEVGDVGVVTADHDSTHVDVVAIDEPTTAPATASEPAVAPTAIAAPDASVEPPAELETPTERVEPKPEKRRRSTPNSSKIRAKSESPAPHQNASPTPAPTASRRESARTSTLREIEANPYKQQN